MDMGVVEEVVVIAVLTHSIGDKDDAFVCGVKDIQHLRLAPLCWKNRNADRSALLDANVVWKRVGSFQIVQQLVANVPIMLHKSLALCERGVFSNAGDVDQPRAIIDEVPVYAVGDRGEKV